MSRKTKVQLAAALAFAVFALCMWEPFARKYLGYMNYEDRWEAACWPSKVGLQGYGDENFDGAWAPCGFEHGNCWVTGYKPVLNGRVRMIRTLAVREDDKVLVFVVVNGNLIAVYDGEKQENRFPGLVKGSDPRPPTPEERTTYKSLLERIEKPLLVKETERQIAPFPNLGDRR